MYEGSLDPIKLLFKNIKFMIMAWRSLLLVLLIVGFLVWYFENQSNNQNTNRSNEDALDILQKRYAKGEISLEEYEEKRDVLEGNY